MGFQLMVLEEYLVSELMDLMKVDFLLKVWQIFFLSFELLPIPLLVLLSSLFLFYIKAKLFLFFFENGLLKSYQFLNSIHKYYYFEIPLKD